MNLKIKNYNLALYMQEGGTMETGAPAGSPADSTTGAGAPEQTPTGGEDPMIQLVQAALQAVETQDANLAMQVCQALVQIASGAAEPAPTQAPVYKMGGKLSHWIKK